MDIAVIVTIGTLMCVSFSLGALMVVIATSQKNDKKLPIKLQNPIKLIEEKKENKILEREMKKEQEIYRTIAENIDNYDGTSRGQKKMPK
jgi:hypothetical protein